MSFRKGTGFGGDTNDFDSERRRRALVNETQRDAETCSYFKVSNQTLVFGTRGSDAAWLFHFLHSDDSKILVQKLKETFRNQVPTDWSKRSQLYSAALQVCSTLASDLQLATLFGTSTRKSDSLLNCLLDFSHQAELVAKRSSDADHDLKDLLLATQVLEVKDEAERAVSQLHGQQAQYSQSITTTAAAVARLPTEEEYYKQQLGPLRFELVPTLSHHAFDDYTAPGGGAALDTRQVFRELASYRTTLPVEYGSSIFVRAVDQRLDMIRALIIGPENTPYAHGIFIFDILLPPSYPNEPPKVLFKTTGNGKVRFNPNLYANGKVCLSLLGTWEGPSWIPGGESTLLQLLISIQSLILVPDPYFNEPGWEARKGTREGQACAEAYNKQLRFHTQTICIQDVLESLTMTSGGKLLLLDCPEFKDVVVKHFLVKKHVVEKQAREWAQLDLSLSSSTIKVCRMLKLLSHAHPGIAREPPPPVAQMPLSNVARVPREQTPPPTVSSPLPSNVPRVSKREAQIPTSLQTPVSNVAQIPPSNVARVPPPEHMVASIRRASARPPRGRGNILPQQQQQQQLRSTNNNLSQQQQQQQRANNLKFCVVVPPNIQPGDKFDVLAMGKIRTVICPQNAKPGDSVEFFIEKNTFKQQQEAEALPEEIISNSPNVMAIGPDGSQGYIVAIPPDVAPGEQFHVMVDGQAIFVKCPMNAGPRGAVKIFPPSRSASTSRATSRSASPNVSRHSGYSSSEAEEEKGFYVKIPPGVQPGQHFVIDRDGTRLVVTCPPHAREGEMVRYNINISATPVTSNAHAVAQPLLQRQQTPPRQQLPLQEEEGEVFPVTIYYNSTEEWARVLSTDDRKFYWHYIGSSSSSSNGGRFDVNKLALARKLVILPNNTGYRAGHLSLVPIEEADFESEARTTSEGNTLLVSSKDLAEIQAKSVEERVQWFRGICSQLRVDSEEGHMIINVRDKFLLTDSVQAVMSLSRRDLRKVWKFRHVGGDYMDNLQEFQWYQSVMKDLFDPDLGLWQYSNAVNQLRMQIHPASEFCVEEHLLYFRFCGRIMGKALLEARHLITAPLDPYIYKLLLGWPIQFQDMEHVNEEHYKHLAMLDSWAKRGEGISLLCLYFTTTSQVLGSMQEIELVPGGAHMSVTNENFQQYVETNIKYRLVECVKPQLTELVLGFFDVIPEALLAVFDYIELEQMLMFKATTPYDAF